MSEFSPARLAGERVERGRLANGVSWVLWPDARDSVASCEVWVRTGSSHERPGGTGLAHMLEHLMFRGTHAFPDGAFDAEMDAMGAMINASTWLDFTVYTSTFPPDGLRRVLELESDRFRNLCITEEVFQAEREVVANERRQTVDAEPLARMSETFSTQVWGSSSYGWPTIGWTEDIAAYTRDAVQAFWERNYAAERICVCLAGPLDRHEVEALLDATFGALDRHTDEFVPVEVTARPAQQATVRLPVRSPRVLMGWIGPGRSDPTWPAWMLTRDLLAGSDAARLPRRLEIDEHAALDCGAHFSGHCHANLLELDLTPRSGVSHRKLTTMALEELQRLADEGPTPEELRGTALRMRRHEVTRLSTTSGRCEALGTSWVQTGDPLAGLDLVDRLAELQAHDVRAVAQTLATHAAPHRLVALPGGASAPTPGAAA